MRSKLLIILFGCVPFLSNAQTDTIPGNQLLDLSLEELMNIKVVTASGFLQTTQDAPSTIIVITAQQIKERGYEQLEDALRDVPGIDMIHVNGYVPTLIYFRGMYGAENQRALLMIDGIVENNILGSNDMAGPAYSLHNIERIEIIWGPVSALYGANAFGGVINMITKKGSDIKGLQYEQGYGSFKTSFQKLNLGLRKGHFEFAASGSLFSTDGPKFTNRDPDYSASYVDKATSFITTLSYYTKTTKTTAGFRSFRTPMGWGTYSNSPTTYLHLPSQGNNNAGIIGVLQRDFRGERSGLLESYLRTWFLQTELKPSDKFNLLVRLTYRETGSGNNSYIYVTTDGKRMIRAKIATSSTRMAGRFDGNYSISKKQKLVFGFQYMQDNVEAGSRSTTFDLSTIYLVDGRDTVVNLNSTFLPRKYDIRNNAGAYLQYLLNIDWLNKTDFTLGLRYDHNSYFGEAWSPRLSVVNHPSERFTIKLQYGHAFRAPTNLEIYQTPGRNFKLKQEELNTYEVNLIYTPSNKLRLQLNGFRNDMNDVIVLANLNNLTPDKNPAKLTIHGAELISEWVMAKSFSGFLNMTFMDTWGRNLVTGAAGKLPGIARIKGNAGITAYVEEFFNVSISANAVGKRPVQRTNPYGPVKGYVLTNGVISTSKIYKDKITASLIIYNVFDVKWLDPGFRTADGLLYSTVLEQPGINGLFKIGITL